MLKNQFSLCVSVAANATKKRTTVLLSCAVLLLQFSLSGPQYPVFKVRWRYRRALPRPALTALVQGQWSHLVPAS